MELSRLVLTDFLQVAPDRTVTVTRSRGGETTVKVTGRAYASNLASSGPSTMQVTTESAVPGHDLPPAFVTLSDLEAAFRAPPLVLRDLLGPYDGAGLPPQCSPIFMGGIEAGGSWRDIDHRMHFFVAAPSEAGWAFLVNVSEFAAVEGAQEAFGGSRAAPGSCAGFTEQGVDWEVEEVRDVGVGGDAFVYAGTAEQSYPPGRVSELGPARVCWIYVRVQALITAIGVHGPQQDLEVGSCTAVARTAADRLQQ